MKKRTVFLITILIIGTSIQMKSQEKTPNRISGGVGYFMPGYAGFNLGNLNTLFQKNNYPAIDNGSVMFGGGGHLIFNNFIIGGEGHGFSVSEASNTNYYINMSWGYGFFNLGYILFRTPTTTIYPLVGFGGGGATITITDKRFIPETFNDLLENPARESNINNGGFMMNFSIGTDFFVVGSRTEDTSGGWLVGLKTGYILNLSNNGWHSGHEELAGSPNADISGPYIRLTFGGGGFGK